MKTLFTVHAGEFLVGSEIEKRIPGANVWVPSKDKGIDLLVTNSNNTKLSSIQVKFSKDFLETHMKDFPKGLLACGWWSLSREKIKGSIADLWIFVLRSFDPNKTQYIIISPKELDQRLSVIHGFSKRLQSYLWVTEKSKCWETRGLSKNDQLLIPLGRYANKEREFTKYLNTWENVEQMLK